MNINYKSLLAAIVVPAVMIATPAIAASEGQIEGGNIYRVKNVTQNIDFTNPVNATSCDTVQYRVRIHNPGPGALSAVNVKATLPAGAATTNTSTVTISAVNADPASTSATATVNLSSALSIGYLGGSTQLLDQNGNFISNLPDGITAGGVNIGNVGVSTQEKRFVQFAAKVNCPSTPPVTPPVTPGTPAAATTLPDTGAEAGLATMLGSGALGYAAVMYRRSRQRLAAKLARR